LWWGGGSALLPGNSDRTKGIGLKLFQESSRLDMRVIFFSVVRHRLPGEVVESPSLEVVKESIDEALRDEA